MGAICDTLQGDLSCFLSRGGGVAIANVAERGTLSAHARAVNLAGPGGRECLAAVQAVAWYEIGPAKSVEPGAV